VIGMLYSFWVGNHRESNVRVCAALKWPGKNQTVWSRRGATCPSSLYRL